MRRVAESLDTGAMSLHRHVNDKQELLVLMLDDVAAGCPPLPVDGSPADRLVRPWVVTHEYLREHTWVVDVLAEGEVFAPRALRLLDIVADAMSEAGFGPVDAMRAYQAIRHLVLGSLVAHRTWQPKVRARRMALLESVPLDDLPAARRMVATIAGQDTRPSIEVRLQALVDGILRTWRK